jgi:hypothetical protein
VLNKFNTRCRISGFCCVVVLQQTLTNVALNSPADVSTLSDITDTPTKHAPENEERAAVANYEQGMMPRLEL